MKILIYGSRNFSETIASLVRHCGHEVVGKIDDQVSGPNILGNLTDVASSHPPGQYGLALAVGYSDLPARWQAWQRVLALGYECPPLVHPRAYVAPEAQLSPGVMVMAGALVDVRAVIGEASVLWPASCVNHDSIVGSNCFLSPRATICGLTEVGNNCFIGAGAVIVDHCRLPAGSFIKAAAMVKSPRI